VVLDCSSMPWIDFTGAESLAELDRAFADAGVELHLAAVRGPVADVLARLSASTHLIGRDRSHPDVAAAADALQKPDGTLTSAPAISRPGDR
jgi:anti-anti-sigma regulatory factor